MAYGQRILNHACCGGVAVVDALMYDGGVRLRARMDRRTMYVPPHAVEPVLPSNAGKTGAPYHPYRPIITGIFWRLVAGAP